MLVCCFVPASRRQFIAFVECPKFRPTNYVVFLKCAELAPLRFVVVRFGSTDDRPFDVVWSFLLF